MRLKGKSRTGHGYYRGPCVWPPDRWAYVDVDEATAALLLADSHLDVVHIVDGVAVGAPHSDLQNPEDIRLRAVSALYSMGVTPEVLALRDENSRLQAENSMLVAEVTRLAKLAEEPTYSKKRK